MAVEATFTETHNTPDHDSLVPDPIVQKELGVTAMCIWRWDRDDELNKLGWPPAIRINLENSAAGSHLRISSALWPIERSSNAPQLKAATAQGAGAPKVAR